ncbi:hypothetical protein PVAP13_4KG057881 [Panicum virgatum]|uniref:Uncharacterized protein n=1 Tax=Panicum virgatum TaxID=38727 RepID=A0A8T0TJL8_PANVG|nr:hypothetical protein PVAP13_4KG057881 [Panicum virgatum]
MTSWRWWDWDFGRSGGPRARQPAAVWSGITGWAAGCGGRRGPRGTHLSVAVRGGWLIEAADGGYSSFHLLLGSAAARGRQVRRNALIFPSYLSPARGEEEAGAQLLWCGGGLPPLHPRRDSHPTGDPSPSPAQVKRGAQVLPSPPSDLSRETSPLFSSPLLRSISLLITE